MSYLRDFASIYIIIMTTYACTMCDSKFYSSGSLSKHTNLHSDKMVHSKQLAQHYTGSKLGDKENYDGMLMHIVALDDRHTALLGSGKYAGVYDCGRKMSLSGVDKVKLLKVMFARDAVSDTAKIVISVGLFRYAMLAKLYDDNYGLTHLFSAPLNTIACNSTLEVALYDNGTILDTPVELLVKKYILDSGAHKSAVTEPASCFRVFRSVNLVPGDNVISPVSRVAGFVYDATDITRLRLILNDKCRLDYDHRMLGLVSQKLAIGLSYISFNCREFGPSYRDAHDSSTLPGGRIDNFVINIEGTGGVIYLDLMGTIKSLQVQSPNGLLRRLPRGKGYCGCMSRQTNFCSEDSMWCDHCESESLLSDCVSTLDAFACVRCGMLYDEPAVATKGDKCGAVSASTEAISQ